MSRNTRNTRKGRKTGKNKRKTGRKGVRKSRRYRGGCEKCTQSAEHLWGDIRGGSNQINDDIYNYRTDPYFYSSA